MSPFLQPENTTEVFRIEVKYDNKWVGVGSCPYAAKTMGEWLKVPFEVFRYGKSISFFFYKLGFDEFNKHCGMKNAISSVGEENVRVVRRFVDENRDRFYYRDKYQIVLDRR